MAVFVQVPDGVLGITRVGNGGGLEGLEGVYGEHLQLSIHAPTDYQFGPAIPVHIRVRDALNAGTVAFHHGSGLISAAAADENINLQRSFSGCPEKSQGFFGAIPVHIVELYGLAVAAGDRGGKGGSFCLQVVKHMLKLQILLGKFWKGHELFHISAGAAGAEKQQEQQDAAQKQTLCQLFQRFPPPRTR